MYLTVQFHRGEEFVGKSYDYQLVVGKEPPKVGDVIRMLSDDEKRAICNGTRVKVLAVKAESDCAQPQVISYKKSSMEEPSLTGL